MSAAVAIGIGVLILAVIAYQRRMNTLARSRRRPTADRASMRPAAGRSLLGIGTALVYPTLLAVIADAYGLTTAIWSVAALTAASGLMVAVRMYETHPAHDGLYPTFFL
jgi:hypothetical protein